MKLHLIGIFHTIHNNEYSHCAFTGKAMRFSKMLGEYYDIVEYANEGSESVSCTKEVILTREEVLQYYPRKDTDFYGVHAVIGSPGWNTFNARLIERLRKNVKPGDIICQPFAAHTSLVQDFPQAAHLETGIGYPNEPFGAWRIFESEAWRHRHWGRWETLGRPDSGMNTEFSWVIPNYYDLSEWQVSVTSSSFSAMYPGRFVVTGNRKYVAFMGRIDAPKGSIAYGVIARTWYQKYPKSNLLFVMAGQGDFAPVQAESGLDSDKLYYMGPISGGQRSFLMEGAIANLMPTRFIEPFGGSGVEGMLCGTPLIATDSGAFTETVQNGVNGYRCKTLADWIWALEHVEFLDRAEIAKNARAKYSLEACRMQYIKAIECIAELCSGVGKGWNASRSFALDNAGITAKDYYQAKQPEVISQEIQQGVTERLAQRVGELLKEKNALAIRLAQLKDGLAIEGGSTGTSAPIEDAKGANGPGDFTQEATTTSQGKPRLLNPEQIAELRKLNTLLEQKDLVVSGYATYKAKDDQVARDQVARDRAFEAAYWGDCTNTHEEEEKHYVYARLMGLKIETVPNRAGYYNFVVPGWSEHVKPKILDIGGGPVSMLLKTKNFQRGCVVDPTKYPDWIHARYQGKAISWIEMEAESYEAPNCFDEVWIYNVLQHVRDPEKIIQNALQAAPILRLFEWIDIPPHEGHPHMLTGSMLAKWIGRDASAVGQIATLNERGCVGRAFYGVFSRVH